MEKQQTSKWKDLCMQTLKLYGDADMLVYAGNATLFIVTAAAPFIMLILTIVNRLPWYSPEAVTDVLLQLLPDMGSIQDMIQSMMNNLKGQSGALLATGAALTTLWSASAGVNAIRKGLDQLDGEKAVGVSNLHRRLFFTIVMIILFPTLLLFGIMGNSILDLVASILERLGAAAVSEILETLTSLLNVSKIIVSVASFFVILAIYAYMPVKRHTLKSRLPGAVFTGISWFLFTKLFSFFIPRFYRSSSLYGSLASLFLVLLWLRVIMMILFGGAALNKTLEDSGWKMPKRQKKAGAK